MSATTVGAPSSVKPAPAGSSAVAVPGWIAPGAVAQAAAPIGLNVAPIAALPASGRIVCAAGLAVRTSPGARRAQLEARSGPADGAEAGQVSVSASTPWNGLRPRPLR